MVVKKQHYVPQSYLINFSSNKRSVYVYDKKEQKSFVSSIRDVANGKYFYDLSEEQELKLGAKQFIEKFFIPLEGVTASTINDILKRSPQDDACFTSNEISLLSQYLYYQYIRTKEYREFSTTAAKTMLKALIGLHLKLKFPKEEKFDYEIQVNEALAHAKDILNEKRAKECIPTFIGRYWIIVENKTQMPFYTSDHPFTRIAHKINPLLSNAGIRSEGIEIAFPISSKFIIILLEKSFFKKYEKYHQKKIIFNDIENINFYNWLQIKDSYRQVYCETECFQLVKKSLTISPYLFDIDRPRIKVEIIRSPDGNSIMHNQLLYTNISSKEVLGKPFFS